MPTAYIRNAIKFLRKKQQELIDAIGADAEQNEEYLDCAGKILELVDEYFSRQGRYFDNPNAPIKNDLERVIDEIEKGKKDQQSIVDKYFEKPTESFAQQWRKKFKHGSK